MNPSHLQDLRQTFSYFATGITIITIKHSGAIYGMTVNSFTSLSLSPPLLLWCLAKGEHLKSFELFSSAEEFYISILNSQQQKISQFAARHDSHLIDKKYLNGHFIKDAIAGFECSVEKKIESGDHIIVISRVNKSHIMNPDSQPLIFYNKNYYSLK